MYSRMATVVTATATDACGTPTVTPSDGSVSTNGCILTQTRTIWAATFSALFVMICFIAIRHSYFGFQAKTFRRFALLLIVFFGIGLSAALIFNPNTFGRLSEVGNASEADVSESGLVKNSLVSRVFIWHTAYNAFIANPILGIGAYSFPFSSQYYYTIPKYFYKNCSYRRLSSPNCI